MNLNFCPNCGYSTLEQQSQTKYQCSNCLQYFWNNPKAAVAVIFLKDGQALFSKRAIEPNVGKYDFPGGFVEYGEDVGAAAVREVAEETGVKIDPSDLEYVTTSTEEYLPGISVVDIIFTIHKWQGEFVAADDSLALEWHPLEFISSNQCVPFYYTVIKPKLQALSSK